MLPHLNTDLAEQARQHIANYEQSEHPLYLNLNEAHLTPDLLEQIINTLTPSQRDAIKRLTLRHNQLSSLPNNIDKLTNLCILDISHNNIPFLPPSINNLGLMMLDCRNNPLRLLPKLNQPNGLPRYSFWVDQNSFLILVCTFPNMLERLADWRVIIEDKPETMLTHFLLEAIQHHLSPFQDPNRINLARRPDRPEAEHYGYDFFDRTQWVQSLQSLRETVLQMPYHFRNTLIDNIIVMRDKIRQTPSLSQYEFQYLCNRLIMFLRVLPKTCPLDRQRASKIESMMPTSDMEEEAAFEFVPEPEPVSTAYSRMRGI